MCTVCSSSTMRLQLFIPSLLAFSSLRLFTGASHAAQDVEDGPEMFLGPGACSPLYLHVANATDL